MCDDDISPYVRQPTYELMCYLYNIKVNKYRVNPLSSELQNLLFP